MTTHPGGSLLVRKTKLLRAEAANALCQKRFNLIATAAAPT